MFHYWKIIIFTLYLTAFQTCTFLPLLVKRWINTLTEGFFFYNFQYLHFKLRPDCEYFDQLLISFWVGILPRHSFRTPPCGSHAVPLYCPPSVAPCPPASCISPPPLWGLPAWQRTDSCLWWSCESFCVLWVCPGSASDLRPLHGSARRQRETLVTGASRNLSQHRSLSERAVNRLLRSSGGSYLLIAGVGQ